MAGSGPRRDRRKPLRPRQIILAVLVALGVGALLSSGALVGLAERQPLGTQRDIALGAANMADRVAHALSLNRPAAELAAAFEDEQEVYDVEALIARASATAPAAPAPAPEPPAEREPEAATAAETVDVAPEESDGNESEPGPPTDGIITPIVGIDCVPIEEGEIEEGEPQPAADEAQGTADTGGGDSEPDPDDNSEAPREPGGGDAEPDPNDNSEAPREPGGGDAEPDPNDNSEAPREPGGPNAEPDPVEDAGGGTSTTTATTLDGSDPPTETDAEAIPNAGEDSGDEPDGDSGETTTDGGTGPSLPGECPPGYVLADEGAGDEADDPDGEEDGAVGITFDAPRTPDGENPLEMYVGGDSISRDLGEGLARVTPTDVVRIDLDPHPATGLSRPDFFDWSQHLAGVLTESSPDVIVVLFGANDFQNVEYEGEILDRFEGSWLDLYRERVDRIMTLLSQPDTQTIWVGQPPVRESRLSGGLAMLNEVYTEQAAEHPQVTYVDAWDIFSDDDGGYVDEIDGVRVRREDGVHLTIAGGNRLAQAVWSAIAAAWGLE